MNEAGNLPRVVVDTNVFVSGLIRQAGLPYALLLHWQQGAFVLLFASEQRSELADVLSRPRISPRYHLSDKARADFLLLMDTLGIRLSLRKRLPVTIRDPKDNHLIAAALGGKADYLVTGDEDLLVLRDDPRLKRLQIVTATEFLNILGRDDTGDY